MQLLQVLLLAAACTGYALAAEEHDPTSYLTSQTKRPKYTTAAEVWSKHWTQPRIPEWETLKKATADTWGTLPVEYDPKYRNPCWRDAAGHFHCMPYFLILGVSKSGTTDLHGRLANFHPEVVEGRRKGPHFWDNAPYPMQPRLKDTYERNFAGYIGLYDRAAEQIFKNPLRVTGEASSNTFTGVLSYCRGMENAQKYNLTLAQYFWEATPWARFIVMFRDPVDRYYSAYYYYNRWNHSGMEAGNPEDFHKQTLADIKLWGDNVKEMGEFMTIKLYRPLHLIKGMYHVFIPPWLEIWPRDHFMFIRTEDYKAAMKKHIQAVAEFLGLSPLSQKQWMQLREAEKENTQAYEDMMPKTKKILQEFYRPHNEKLVKAFDGDTRWLWTY